jgi:hypothetical protein
MSLELVLPQIDNKTSSKDLIISVLAEEWPLSVKELFSKISKEFRFKGTYQAVFKSVKELQNKKVLVKTGEKYELNISWIKNLQSFTETVETNYYATKKLKKVLDKNKKGEDTILMNFESIFDAEKYLYYFVKNELKKSEPTKVFFEMNNLWKVLFYYRAEYNYYTKLEKLGHKFFFLTSSKTKIEKQAIEFYKRLNIKIKQTKAAPTDSIVFGDHYIQIFIPEETKEKIDKLLNQENSFELIKLLSEENLIKVIVHKDKALAEGIAKKLEKLF